MPTSAAGNNAALARSRRVARAPGRPGRVAEHGFTLVELMVVVTIIALGAAAVTWALPDARGRVRDEAARFALRVRAAHDEAIVTGRPISVWVTIGGYGFDQRVAGQWVAMGDRPLRVDRWADGTRAIIPDVAGRARVTFDPTGLADRPLDLRLQRGGAAAGVHVAADGGVAVDG